MGLPTTNSSAPLQNHMVSLQLGKNSAPPSHVSSNAVPHLPMQLPNGSGPCPLLGPSSSFVAAGQAGIQPSIQASETCDKLLRDNSIFERRLMELRTEIEVLQQDRNNLRANFCRFYETAYNVSVELALQTELNSRYYGIIQSMLPHLNPELQSKYHHNLELAKKLNLGEIEEQVNKGSLFMPHNFFAYHEERRGGHPFSTRYRSASHNNINRPFSDDNEGPKKSKIEVEEESNRESSGPFGGSRRRSVSDDAYGVPGRMTFSYPNSDQYSTNYEFLDSSNEQGGTTFINYYARGRPPLSINAAQNGPYPYNKPYAFVCEENSVKPVEFPPDARVGPDIPTGAQFVGNLEHSEVVCAVAISNNSQHIFTGGKGGVKMWDLNSRNKVADLPCLEDTYIRSCKVLPGDRKILVGGECDSLFLWDVGNGAPRILGELKSETAACYAMAIAPATARQRSPICFACCSNGNINVWDVHNQVLIRSFKGHDEGASCVDVFSDGSKLATGGLDRCVRVWDLAEDSEILQYPFEHKVFALGVSPTSNFLAVGLKSNYVEVFDPKHTQRAYRLVLHENWVLSLKFSSRGRWFTTTGKDKMLMSWRAPYGACLFQKRQSDSILSCDISLDDRYIVTGSEKRATVYELQY